MACQIVIKEELDGMVVRIPKKGIEWNQYLYLKIKNKLMIWNGIN